MEDMSDVLDLTLIGTCQYTLKRQKQTKKKKVKVILQIIFKFLKFSKHEAVLVVFGPDPFISGKLVRSGNKWSTF